MKHLIIKILIINLIVIQSHASHIRFWVGFKKKDVTTEFFLNGLNKIFFGETIQVGQGKGLISYQPYITQMNKDIPDELALVVYENEEKYRQIRATPEGQQYGIRHWDYFEKEKSKSTVAQNFEGKLEQGSAYELNPQFVDWQKGNTHVAIYSVATDFDSSQLAKAFEKLKINNAVQNAVLLVTTKWVIEYRSMKNLDSAYEKLPLTLVELKTLPKKSLTTLKDAVGFEQGVNFQFQ